MPISAKMTDVPSHSWVLPTLLSHAGIKLLQLGCNSASQYPRVPPLFWWEGADGSKVICQYTPCHGPRLPLLTGVADGTAGQHVRRESGLSTSRGGALVTAFGQSPDGAGANFRLWEQAGVSGDVTVFRPRKSIFTKATPVNLRGEVIRSVIAMANDNFSFFMGAYALVSFVLE